MGRARPRNRQDVESMSRYQRETQVMVFPFTRQIEGDEVVIGRTDTATFLALPADAVEVLDLLAEGTTVGEVQDRFADETGQVPEMEDFLTALESSGFVAPRSDTVAVDAMASASAGNGSSPRAAVRYHFTSLSPGFCRRLVGRSALLVYAAIVAASVGVLVADPSLLPGPRALVFPQNTTLMLLAVAALTYTIVFLHELGHVVATRAAGVPSRLGISHRLWVLVAEADLTGLWSVERRQRYLPFLAGPLVDLVVGASLLLTLAAHHLGALAMPAPVLTLVRAMVFVELMALGWQCFFFVRTDLYYVIATAFGCKNLLGDTETWLRNRLARWIPRLEPVDQSALPSHELRAIRAYAVVWLVGRAVALAFLALVTLPLAVAYAKGIGASLGAGIQGRPYPFTDALVAGLLMLAPLSVGFTLWIRSLVAARQT